MDVPAFKDWLVVERGMADITSRVLVKRLLHAQKNGLDLTAFQADPEKACKQYLSGRARSATSHAYNNDVKLLTNMALFLGKKVTFAYRRPNPTPPRALPKDQLEKLRAYEHKNPRVSRFRRAAIALLLESGLRPSEAAKLDVEDLDPVRSTIRIKKPAKRGLVREIPVPRSMWRPRSPMMAYLRHRPTPANLPRRLWVKDWNGWERPMPAWPVTVDAFRRELARVSKELGFRVNHTFLRHTVATRSYKESRDVLFVKFLLGHAAISSTMVYTETSQEDMIDNYHRRRRSKRGVS